MPALAVLALVAAQAAGAVILAGGNGGFGFQAAVVAVFSLAGFVTQGGFAFAFALLTAARFRIEQIAKRGAAERRLEFCLLFGLCRPFAASHELPAY